MLADVSAQAGAGAGYDAARFDVDFDTATVTCPQGKTSSRWSLARQRGTETIVVEFDTATCRACPARAQCTSATRGARQLTIRPRRVHQALAAARAQQTTKRLRPRLPAARRRGRHQPPRPPGPGTGCININ